MNAKTALHISTTGEVAELDISSQTLTKLQTAVGGWVEAIDLTERLTMWCNEEGKIISLPHNPYAQYFWDKMFGAHTDYIVGDIVLTGGVDSEGETVGLSAEQVEWVQFFIGKVRQLIEPSIIVI